MEDITIIYNSMVAVGIGSRDNDRESCEDFLYTGKALKVVALIRRCIVCIIIFNQWIGQNGKPALVSPKTSM